MLFKGTSQCSVVASKFQDCICVAQRNIKMLCTIKCYDVLTVFLLKTGLNFVVFLEFFIEMLCVMKCSAIYLAYDFHQYLLILYSCLLEITYLSAVDNLIKLVQMMQFV